MLMLPLVFAMGVTGCEGEAKPSAEDTKKKANEVCGADEKAVAEGSACKACCKEQGVDGYQYDGMKKSCTCS